MMDACRLPRRSVGAAKPGSSVHLLRQGPRPLVGACSPQRSLARLTLPTGALRQRGAVLTRAFNPSEQLLYLGGLQGKSQRETALAHKGITYRFIVPRYVTWCVARLSVVEAGRLACTAARTARCKANTAT